MQWPRRFEPGRPPVRVRNLRCQPLILRLSLAAQDLLPTVVVVVVVVASFPTGPRRFKNVCMASLKKSKRLVYPAKTEKKRENVVE